MSNTYDNHVDLAFSDGNTGAVLLQGHFAYSKTRKEIVPATEDAEAYETTIVEPVVRMAEMLLFKGLTFEQSLARSMLVDSGDPIPDSLKTEDELNPAEEEEVL